MNRASYFCWRMKFYNWSVGNSNGIPNYCNRKIKINWGWYPWSNNLIFHSWSKLTSLLRCLEFTPTKEYFSPPTLNSLISSDSSAHKALILYGMMRHCCEWLSKEAGWRWWIWTWPSSQWSRVLTVCLTIEEVCLWWSWTKPITNMKISDR